MNAKRFLPLCLLAAVVYLVGCQDEGPLSTTQDTARLGEPTTIGDAPSGLVPAAAGDLIMNTNLAVPGFGVSAGADCDGVLYYTNSGSPTLYKMDAFGADLGSVPTLTPAGAQVFIDELAWDPTRNVFWGQEHGSNPVDVYQIDPATGVTTFQWTSATNSVGTFRDGIAYDINDDTIWISGDVSDTIEHYTSAGGFLGAITPTNAAGGTLGLISGVLVGVGDLLYLGRNGAVEIVQVQKSDGAFLQSFASPGGARDEGLACDVTNFAPLTVLWSREANTPGFLSAIEIEEGTCECVRTVNVDIRPQSCRNPLNVGQKGVLPVAILGTGMFDVTEVDPETVTLEGVSPLRWSLYDVATPFIGSIEEAFDCTDEGPDGFLDLTLKFNAQEVVAALGPVGDGDVLVLTLEGNLFDGSPFQGVDVVVILEK